MEDSKVSAQVNQTILDRHISEGKLNAFTAFSEIDARIKNLIAISDEIKEALQGMAEWARKTDERLQKLDPKIDIVSPHDAKVFLNSNLKTHTSS